MSSHRLPLVTSLAAAFAAGALLFVVGACVSPRPPAADDHDDGLTGAEEPRTARRGRFVTSLREVLAPRSTDAGDDADVADADADAGGSVPVGPPQSPTLCALTTTPTNGATPVAGVPSGLIHVAVSGDELTTAWTRQVDGEIFLEYADRPSTSSPFGAPRRFRKTTAGARFALSSDGLALVTVASDGLGFEQATRLDPTSAFDGASEAPFAAIRSSLATGPADVRVDAPHLTHGDRFFLYTRVEGPSARIPVVASRFETTSPFSPGAEQTASELRPGRPSFTVVAVADDLRTWFADDEDAGTSSLTWTDPAGAAVASTTVALVRDARPSASCDRLWFLDPSGTLSVAPQR